MKPSVACLLLLFPLASCMVLKQESVNGGGPDDHFGYYETARCGLLQIGASSKPKEIKLVEQESYAISPDGVRYRIQTEEHPFDIEQGYPYIRDRVYLIDKTGTRVSKDWKNGKWEFHFVIQGPKGRETRDFEPKYWNFYYCILIHGAPN